MAAEMPVRKFPWICTFVVLICIVTIVIIWVRCPWGCLPGGVIEDGVTYKGKLVIENSETATWSPFNNTFAGNGEPDCSNCYHGVLIQVGAFPDGGYHCDKIALYKGGQPVVENGKPVEYECSDPDKYHFVSIAPETANPMLLGAQASYLSDWGMDEYCCDDLTACKNAGTPIDVCWKQYEDCAKQEPVKCFGGECSEGECVGAECKPPRKLHQNQTVLGTVAFWHGESGYDLTTIHSPKNGQVPPLDRFEFLFDNTFRVQAFRFTATPEGGCFWEPVANGDNTYPDVDEIRIESADGPPDVVIHSDPPWPTKSGP